MGKTIPEWLRQPEGVALPQPRPPLWERDYLAKTQQAIMAVFQADHAREQGVRYPGMLQKLSPAVKIAVAGLVLLTLGSLSSLLQLLVWLAVLAVVAVCSGLTLACIGRRLGLLLVFPLFMALPAATVWVTPGEAVFSAGPGAYLTWSGLLVAGRLLVRTLDCLLLIQLLLLSTRWVAITQGLRQLGLQQFWVYILDLTYRYLFLFLPLLGDFLAGRRSRLTGREKSQGALEWVGRTTAGFFRLTWEYNKEIAQAMQGRCFSWTDKQRRWQWGQADWRFIFVVVLFCGFSIWLK